jgi:hypothetical protein
MRHPVMTGAWVCRSESDPIQVLSAVELAEEEAIGLILPSYHVSAVVIDAHGAPTRSCTDSELDIVREAFQMDGADEDNHGHGLVRHLWLAVGARVEDPCACKQDEPTTVDGPREWRP